MELEKFYYWITEEKIDEITKLLEIKFKDLKIRNVDLRQCESLNPHWPIVIVGPDVWSNNCKRQGSWFRQSKFSTSFLIVSNTPINNIQSFCSGKLKMVQIPSVNNHNDIKINELINHPVVKENTPQEWFNFLDREVPLFKKYLESRGIVLSLEKFLEYHTAGHANFLIKDDSLIFKAEYNGEYIPCSLFSEEYTCSACLEIFGVIGEHHKKLLIKRCPGLKYLKMDKDEYILTEKCD